MTAKDRAVAAATAWNANSPEDFPGRPLFESLVARAVEQAVRAERRRCRAIARGWVASAADMPAMTGVDVAEHIAEDIGPDGEPSGPW
jgi:hypothetical protein